MITCIICGRDDVTHELTVRTDGARNHLGIHEGCIRRAGGAIANRID